MSETIEVSREDKSRARKAVVAAGLGNALEWYDIILFGFMATSITAVFYPGEGLSAQLMTWATFAITFVVRPLGAILIGRYSDKHGRKSALSLTIGLMTLGVFIIVVLPGEATIGIWGAIGLIIARIIQGISAGGEGGSAVLLAVEHAPVEKRGLFGAGPQAGAPAGLLLSSGMLALMSMIAPGDAFIEWGWRIPFLLSIGLMILGFWIRSGVDESPVFAEIAQIAEQKRANPLGELLRNYFPVVFVGALVFAGNGVVGYMIAGGYVQSWAVNDLGMDRGAVLWAVTGAAVTWLISGVLAGGISDRIGRRNTYLVGFLIQAVAAAALFPLVQNGLLWPAMLLLGVGLGVTYGQQAALYAELFPASVRGSGASITYALGSILGGAFAPTIAAAVVQATGSTVGVTAYLLVATFIGLLAAASLRDRTGIPLGPEHEAEQAERHFTLSR